MPSYPREELEEMVERWLEANRRAEKAGDWQPMAELYTDDAEYSWNTGPNERFMARGREQIREWALGTEMQGLDGWNYPYMKVLIDEKQGEVVGFWKQVADARRPDGTPYTVEGIGGSWFRYAGDFKWEWQADFFDLGNVTALFFEMIEAGVLGEGMSKRLEAAVAGEVAPGHEKIRPE
jgi:hypothetical protein